MNKVIAHVNFSHGFRGGERQTELLIRGLADRGVHQYLLCREESPLLDHLKGTSNLDFITVKQGRDCRVRGHFALGRKADIIQVHETRAAQWALLHYFLYGTPYVITRRVDDRVSQNFFNKFIYQKASEVIGVSSVIAEYMGRSFCINTRTIHSAATCLQPDEENVRKLRASFGDAFVVGHAGALVDRHKGQSLIIEAARELKDQIPNLKVVFLGQGSDEALLKKLASDLPFVEFKGFVDNVTEYFRAFDVFAFPSNNEGLGSVLLDVMAQRCPVVASRVGGIPDLVADGVSGLLIEPKNKEQLKECILKLYKDKSLRDRLTAGGLKVASENSPEQMTKSYLEVYLGIRE